MIDLAIASGLGLFFIAVELLHRADKRRQPRKYMQAAEERQRKQDERVKETWRSGSREDRKSLEVQELERMMHVERRSR